MCCRHGSLKSPALPLELTVIRFMSLQGRDLRHGCREPSRPQASWPFGLPSSRSFAYNQLAHYSALD
jgi:hypothetical protein